MPKKAKKARKYTPPRRCVTTLVAARALDQATTNAVPMVAGLGVNILDAARAPYQGPTNALFISAKLERRRRRALIRVQKSCAKTRACKIYFGKTGQEEKKRFGEEPSNHQNF